MDISYDGILRCYDEGNELLGDYSASLVSVHDPDDYLDGAENDNEKEVRRHNILSAYQCLHDLKTQNKVESVGIGVKNPTVIEFLMDQGVILDWTMIAGVLTPFVHTLYVRTLLKTLHSRSIQVFNCAVFNSGFLVGEDYFNYSLKNAKDNPELYDWRDKFFHICEKYNFSPGHVCVQFSFLFPQVQCVALNACKLEHVAMNFDNVYNTIPHDHDLWQALSLAKLINIE